MLAFGGQVLPVEMGVLGLVLAAAGVGTAPSRSHVARHLAPATRPCATEGTQGGPRVVTRTRRLLREGSLHIAGSCQGSFAPEHSHGTGDTSQPPRLREHVDVNASSSPFVT